MNSPQKILRNACLAAGDKSQSAPQPYGKIVADVYRNDESPVGYALRHPDLALEVIARLLEAAHIAAGEG